MTLADSTIRVIINADDLGKSKHVNSSILELAERNFITSTSIMANAPYFEEAVSVAKKLHDVSIGAHLNITEFKPLTDPEDLTPILDESGCFKKFSSRTAIKNGLRRAIFREWCAQIDKIKASGIKIEHIDSHHHAHTIPSLFFVLKRVQKKYGIRKVRITKNIYSDDLPVRSRMLFLKKIIWNQALRIIYKTRTTSGHTELFTFVKYAQQVKFKHDSVELMIHPGNDQFDVETELLEDSWQTKIPYAMKFISFNEI